jgi:prepilin-type N-terminal cleavage/methylation domain-containing protein/prepilin-type processing-associated H-X9-DG protein
VPKESSLRTHRPGFTLIELLVVIAIIAILAAILFPVFAQTRDRAQRAACSSNMRQIGTALMLYVQDHDETFPHFRFHGDFWVGVASDRGQRIYGWNNAIAPYLKSIDVLACPANPFSRALPGIPASDPGRLPRPGSNAAGWEATPGLRMPISYGLNVCANSWFSADWTNPKAPPPPRVAQLVRPAQTIFLCETNSPQTGFTPEFLWSWCFHVFSHPAGKLANFVFFDGHVQSKKWLSTLYPVSENNWEPGEPDPNPNGRVIRGFPGCEGGGGDGRLRVPPGPGAREFRTQECLAYQ